MDSQATNPSPASRSAHHGPENGVSDDSWLGNVPPIPGDDFVAEQHPDDLEDPNTNSDDWFPLIEPVSR